MKINLPIHPSQVKLKDYVAFMKASDDVERCIVAAKLSRKQVLALKPETVTYIMTKFKTVAEYATDTLTRHVRVRNGIRTMRLSFIPNLPSCSLAEWMDMDDYDRQAFGRPDPQNPNKVTEPDWDKLPLLIGVMYRPLKETFFGDYRIVQYDSENKGHIPFVMNMTMDVVNSAQVFFSTFADKLQKNSQDYLLNQLKTTRQEIEKSH